MSAMNDVNNIKIKCFETYSMSGMEEELTKWISINNIYIVDIRIAFVGSRYTALVVYKEN